MTEMFSIGAGLVGGAAGAALANHYFTGKEGDLKTAEGLKKASIIGVRYASNMAASLFATGAISKTINPNDVPSLDRVEAVAGLATFLFTMTFLSWASKTGNSKDSNEGKDVPWTYQAAIAAASAFAGSITMFALLYILDRK
jgi:hypothetical protein